MPGWGDRGLRGIFRGVMSEEQIVSWCEKAEREEQEKEQEDSESSLGEESRRDAVTGEAPSSFDVLREAGHFQRSYIRYQNICATTAHL